MKKTIFILTAILLLVASIAYSQTQFTTLKLTSMYYQTCGEEELGVMRVRNENDFKIKFMWQAYPGPWYGPRTAYANQDVFFGVPHPATIKIKYVVDNQEYETVKAQNNNLQNPAIYFDPDPVMTTDDAAMTAKVTMKLTHYNAFKVKVAWKTTDGTALDTEDYTAGMGVAKFNVGQMAKTVEIPITEDPYYENDEDFFVHLSEPMCATIQDKECKVMIVNKDPMPIVRIHMTKKAEGDPCNPKLPYTTAYMKVTLSQPAYGREVVKVNRMSSSHTAIYASDVPAGEVPDWDDTMDGWPNVTVAFARDEMEKKLPVHIFRDCMNEEDEYQEFILWGHEYCQKSDVVEERRNMLWIRNDDAPVIADFEAVGDCEGIGSLEVCFKNLSKNANSYLWDFGDGTTSTEKNPCHTFCCIRKYHSVTLKAWQRCCPDNMAEVTKTDFITVCKATTVNFMATPLAGQAPMEVSFTNCCSGLANCFEWTYGDDCCFECQHDYLNPVNPAHIYETEGTYDVTLKASGQGGTETMTVANLIYVNEYALLPLKLLTTDGKPYNEDMDWDKAFDSNPFTYVSASKVSVCPEGPCAEFEFADQLAKRIHKIRLMVVQEARRWSTGYVNELIIMGSDDQTTWTEIWAGEVGKDIGAWDLIVLDTPADAKYVKVILAGTRGGMAFAELGEIIFLGEEVPILKGLAVESDKIPTEFALAQNYPNPFNPETTISISIPEMSHVSVKVFNVRGQEVATLVNNTMEAGIHKVTFDASQLNTGVYFYEMTSANFHEVRRMAFVK